MSSTQASHASPRTRSQSRCVRVRARLCSYKGEPESVFIEWGLCKHCGKGFCHIGIHTLPISVFNPCLNRMHFYTASVRNSILFSFYKTSHKFCPTNGPYELFYVCKELVNGHITQPKLQKGVGVGATDKRLSYKMQRPCQGGNIQDDEDNIRIHTDVAVTYLYSAHLPIFVSLFLTMTHTPFIII